MKKRYYFIFIISLICFFIFISQNWEDYFIMAIALRLNKKIINYFYDYCQNNLGDQFISSLNSFGSYKYMNTIFSASFSSYVSRDSFNSFGGGDYSDSSGGFSGGSSF